jgi:hypothetical protein
MQDADGNLANLHDIVLPAPVSWWPLAPGWYVLAFTLLGIAVFAGWRAHRRWRVSRYRAEALTELHTVHVESMDPAAATTQLMTLLKRTALVAYPRQQVASLSGERWWAFLDERGGTDFSEKLGPMTTSLLYASAPNDGAGDDRVEQLKLAVERWIKEHPAVVKQDRSERVT